MNPSQRDAFNKACAWQGWTPIFRGYRLSDHSKLFSIGTKKKIILICRPVIVNSNYIVHSGYIAAVYALDDDTFQFPINATSAEVFIAMSKILARIEQKVYELNRAT